MTLSEDRGMTEISPTLAISVLPGVPPSIQTERLNKIDVYTTFAKVGGKVPKKLTIDDMHILAESRGGKCLSDTYVNSHTKLEWECSHGHPFLSRPHNVKNGIWCPKCGHYYSGLKRLDTLEGMKKIANERGGDCISKTYMTCRNKLQWQCALGHKWYAKPSSIKHGRWCPLCQKGVGERITRGVFESLFDASFPSCRPAWLKGVKGRVLELDGYNEMLGIAFEYQGVQHYRDSFGTHALSEQQSRDEIKKSLCKQHKIILICIKYTVRQSDIPTEIIKQCKEKNIDISNIPLTIFDINHDRFTGTNKLNALQQIAISKGGKCTSKLYMGGNEKLEFVCTHGHYWKATPASVISGTWCKKCSGNEKLTIEEMGQIAKDRGGKCLSDVYVNAQTKIHWECGKGHTWWAKPCNVKHGSWCKICSYDNKRKIMEAKE